MIDSLSQNPDVLKQLYQSAAERRCFGVVVNSVRHLQRLMMTESAHSTAKHILLQPSKWWHLTFMIGWKTNS